MAAGQFRSFCVSPKVSSTIFFRDIRENGKKGEMDVVELFVNGRVGLRGNDGFLTDSGKNCAL